MGALLLLGFVAVAGASLVYPWVGAIAAYLIAILNPQSIWFWHFAGLRPVLLVTVPLVVGVAILAIRGKAGFGAIANARFGLLAVVVACCAISAYFGPYANRSDPQLIRNASFIFEVQFKIFLLALLASLCVTELRSLRALGWMVVGVSVFFIWWANNEYLSRGWVIRLAGPMDVNGIGPYVDENNFAVLFVATLPFVWFLGSASKSNLLRLAVWIVVPFGWHALFLTGSRGGFVGMAAVLLLVAILSGQRRLGLLLIGAFVVAYFWQAGDVMKERVAGIDDFSEDESASSRIDAWAVALKMMAAYPFTGVGAGAFTAAFPLFSDLRSLQAHNTYLQVGAEYGVLAAVALVTLILLVLRALFKRVRQLASADASEQVRLITPLVQATLVSLAGVFVCSLFLTLQLFELLYFLIFLGNALDIYVGRLLAQPRAAPASR